MSTTMTTVEKVSARERANAGWDSQELAWRARWWDEARWAIEEKWPRGLRVLVTDGPFAGVLGTVRSNRVDAADRGSWVCLDNGEGGLRAVVVPAERRGAPGLSPWPQGQWPGHTTPVVHLDDRGARQRTVFGTRDTAGP